MKIETFLPMFPGFYETQFEYNDEERDIEFINEQRAEANLPEIGYKDVRWDYDTYHQNVSKKAVDYIQELVRDFCQLEFVRLQSPREYNFSTDMIIVSADFDPEKLRAKLFECPESEIEEYIKRFLPSSRFAPFAETLKKANVDYWRETDFDNFHDCGHALEMILRFHPDTEFDENEFMGKSTHEVEVGIDNYNELVLQKQLTSKQLERQDFVDNSIVELLQKLGYPAEKFWNMELIGHIRDAIENVVCHEMQWDTESEFYPQV